MRGMDLWHGLVLTKGGLLEQPADGTVGFMRNRCTRNAIIALNFFER